MLHSTKEGKIPPKMRSALFMRLSCHGDPTANSSNSLSSEEESKEIQLLISCPKTSVLDKDRSHDLTVNPISNKFTKDEIEKVFVAVLSARHHIGE